MVSTAHEQLAATLYKHYADLRASLFEILCLEEDGSNCREVVVATRKLLL
jgi:hypothetical protein